MVQPTWQDIFLSPGNPDHTWELFHENSKLTRYAKPPTDEEVLSKMRDLHHSLPFEGYPVVELPRSLSSLNLFLDDAMIKRSSTLDLIPSSLSLRDIATLFHHAYGVTRHNEGTTFPRPFRTVPSAGALYPLELFFHTVSVDGLSPGLYHYNPAKHHLRLLREGNLTSQVSQYLVQPEVAHKASLQIFLTAVFERSIFKYGDRGYRFVLLEAGHVAQNINLVCTAMDLACINIGGFLDRQLDDFLGLDGLTHSTIYTAMVGQRKPETK